MLQVTVIGILLALVVGVLIFMFWLLLDPEEENK